MIRCSVLLLVFFVLGCGDESELPQPSQIDRRTESERQGDASGRQKFVDSVSEAQQLVRDAVRVLDSIASAVDARAARKELDKLSDKVARLREDMAALGVNPRGDVSFKAKRVEFFSTTEKLRGALVPLQSNDGAWRAIQPAVERFQAELKKIDLGI